MKMNNKAIIICADDFGQSSKISEAILFLMSRKRINATSCLVNMPLWQDVYTTLLPFTNCFLGLHLNLTLGNALSALWRNKYGISFYSLSKLIFLAYSQRLDFDTVASEIESQIDAFYQKMGRYPDFIDGHQHIHQLPIIRDALLSVYSKMYHADCFFRKTYNGQQDFFSLQGAPKVQLLSILGGKCWQNLLLKQQIKANSSFAGVYNFQKSKHYPQYFRHFLKNISHQGLIMCHPGYEASAEDNDPIGSSRYHEFSYLNGEEYQADLMYHGVTLLQKT